METSKVPSGTSKFFVHDGGTESLKSTALGNTVSNNTKISGKQYESLLELSHMKVYLCVFSMKGTSVRAI